MTSKCSRSLQAKTLNKGASANLVSEDLAEKKTIGIQTMSLDKKDILKMFNWKRDPNRILVNDKTRPIVDLIQSIGHDAFAEVGIATLVASFVTADLSVLLEEETEEEEYLEIEDDFYPYSGESDEDYDDGFLEDDYPAY